MFHCGFEWPKADRERFQGASKRAVSRRSRPRDGLGSPSSEERAQEMAVESAGAKIPEAVCGSGGGAIALRDVFNTAGALGVTEIL